ncbi:uncharacterized protein LOC114841274 [Diachasma alloeum]|uniref:uncharacterized protein LOC114841274 n=1 Tax=Diachasma alloeum TaxID=454923 RepID=UPI0010FB7AF7|nr:uncharacterized protein LOC114841274 [Diachasma alloeum]
MLRGEKLERAFKKNKYARNRNEGIRNLQKVLPATPSKHTLHPVTESSLRKRIKLRQIIPASGASSPTLLKITPHVPLRPHDHPVIIKEGIPDAWLQYAALKDVCRPPSLNNIQYKVPCDNMKITDTLLKEFGMSLQQGIPDPFKIHELRRWKRSPSPEDTPRKPKNPSQSSRHDPEGRPPAGDRGTPRIRPQEKREIPEEKQHHQRDTKPNEDKNPHDNTKTKDQSDKLNERVAHICDSSPFSPEGRKTGKMEFSSCRGCPRQTKVGRMMKGIFRRCRNTMRSISNKSSVDVDVNFVCYRCNYPCFRICKVEGCSQPAKISGKKIIFDRPDDAEGLQGMGMRRVNISRGDSATKCEATTRRHKRAARKSRADDLNDSEELSVTSATSAVDSVRTDSFVDVLERKSSDRGNIPFEGRSKDALNSRDSSERLRKYIYEVFPPALESVSSGDDKEERKWAEKFFTRGGSHQIDERNIENAGREGMGGRESENSSLRTEFPEERRGYNNFKL